MIEIYNLYVQPKALLIFIAYQIGLPLAESFISSWGWVFFAFFCLFFVFGGGGRLGCLI